MDPQDGLLAMAVLRKKVAKTEKYLWQKGGRMDGSPSETGSWVRASCSDGRFMVMAILWW